MVQWVVRSILHGGPIELFLVPASVTNDKGRGMCYPVCGMVHIKEPLLLIGKSSLCSLFSFFNCFIIPELSTFLAGSF